MCMVGSGRAFFKGKTLVDTSGFDFFQAGGGLPVKFGPSYICCAGDVPQPFQLGSG